MKRKIKSVYFQMGVGLTAVMTALIVLGFFWTPYRTGCNAGIASNLQGPSLLPISFGTDQFGRDIFSRVLSGRRQYIDHRRWEPFVIGGNQSV